MNRRDFIRIGVSVPFIVQGCGSSSRTKAPVAAPPSSASPLPAGIDVTAEWRALYLNPKAAPGTDYKTGQVHPTELKVVAEKSDHPGYRLVMPGAHPIPTPAIWNDRVFVSGGFGSREFFCLEAATGRQLWGMGLSDDGPSTAAIEDGLVVVNTESCTIFTMDGLTGKPLWSLFLGDPMMSAPTVAQGRVFSAFPAHGGVAHHKEASHLLGCFDLRSGKILWQRWIDGDVISAPVASGTDVVAATFTGSVFRFKQETGEVLSVLNARATSAPVVVAGDLHFSRRSETAGGPQEALCTWDRARNEMAGQYSERRALYLDKQVQTMSALKESSKHLDSANGFSGGAPDSAKAGAAADNMGQSNVASCQGFQGSRILRYGALNISCRGDEVMCNDPGDGRTLWSVPLKGDLKKEGGFLAAPPVAGGRSLFLVGLEGELIELDPKDGSSRKRWNVGHPVRYAPTVEGGRVFIGTQDSRLVCVDTGDARNTGWPQWGRDAQRSGTHKGA